jgi:hypothetical protein
MIEINRNPSRRDLLVFAAILPAFFGLVGALAWRGGSPAGAELLWAVGIIVTLAAFSAHAARRWIYLGWMYATYPIAWTVSHVILAAIYFLVATPIALVLRAIGRDPMQRRFERKAGSYWVPRQQERGRGRYFRQF